LHASLGASVAGAGGSAGSRWALDRARLAELLGCETLVEHAKDAAWQADVYLELLATLDVDAGPEIVFVPMLLIASAFYYMNRADQDCGTTFSWVTRAMGPWAGWIGGWAICVRRRPTLPPSRPSRGSANAAS
jgi:hypothetical protein